MNCRIKNQESRTFASAQGRAHDRTADFIAVLQLVYVAAAARGWSPQSCASACDQGAVTVVVMAVAVAMAVAWAAAIAQAMEATAAARWRRARRAPVCNRCKMRAVTL